MRWSGAAFESPAIVAGLDDVAVVSEAIEQCGGHLGVPEDARPFAEGEIGGDDDRGSFVEPADEMEEELAAGLGEGQIAEFIEDDEVHAGEVIGEPALPAVAGLGFEPIDEIDDIVEPAARAGANAASRNGDGEMGLAGSGSADQHDVALLGDEAAAGEVFDQGLVDGRAGELEVGQVFGEREPGDGELVLDRARLLLADLAVSRSPTTRWGSCWRLTAVAMMSS